MEKKIDPKFNIHENYRRVNIVNSDRYGGGETVFIDQPNLLTYPNEYENSYWTKNGATISPTLKPSPDGTTQAREVTVGVEELGLYTPHNTAVSAGQTVRVSVFVKAASLTNIVIGFNGGTQPSNNKGVRLDVGTSWSKISFETTVNVNDTGLFVAICSGKWDNQGGDGLAFAKVDPTGVRVIDVWGASYNIT